jgi:hypothetical protein
MTIQAGPLLFASSNVFIEALFISSSPASLVIKIVSTDKLFYNPLLDSASSQLIRPEEIFRIVLDSQIATIFLLGTLIIFFE